MRVFIMTDIEGVSGVVSFESQAYSSGKYYEQAKLLLTAELNAAVEGLIESGIDDIIAWDGHGAGAVVFEKMHPAIQLIHGEVWGLREKIYELMKRCDIAIMIGQHAMAGVANGNLNHTQNSTQIIEYRLNGEPIGEIAQFAYSLGEFGIPLIYLSGDKAACQEIETLIPNVVSTAVKEGLGRNAALSLSPQVAQEKIKKGVQDAIINHKKNPIEPTTLAGPYQIEITCTNSLATDQRMFGNKKSERISDLTYRVKSDSILDVIYG